MVTYDMDRRAGLSKYAYLFRCLRHDIRTGALPAGERLPSKRSLAEHLSLSVGTIERAYGELVSEGYLTARPGSGFYVAQRNDWGAWSGLDDERDRPHVPPGEPDGEDADDGPRFDLRANRSSMTLFPADTWSRIMRKTLSDRSPALFETVPFNGTRELREAIATHLFEFRGIHASPDNIVIGAGTEYLYGRLLQLLGPAANIAMGDPGYKRLADVSRNVGTLWSYVPVSTEGMRVDLLAASGANAVHVSPANLFPLGIALPDGDRASLLAWLAERPQRCLIEDDYDSEFSFARRERPPLLTQDTTGRIIYLNTFSKTLVPSIRISYMVLPDELLGLYHEQLSFYSCTVSSFEQLALAEFMRGGALRAPHSSPAQALCPPEAEGPGCAGTLPARRRLACAPLRGGYPSPARGGHRPPRRPGQTQCSRAWDERCHAHRLLRPALGLLDPPGDHQLRGNRRRLHVPCRDHPGTGLSGLLLAPTP